MADLTNTGQYPCVLGTPWLVRHEPTIRWAEKRVTFESPYCLATCLRGNAQTKNQVITVDQSKKQRWRSNEKLNLPVNPELKSGERTPQLVTSKLSMVSPAAFRLSARDAEIYTLVISEVDGPNHAEAKDGLDSIPHEYRDLYEVFSEKSSNEFPDHGSSDMKIEFNDG